MVANRTTDFNPDWIGMIVLLVSELVKLQHQFELKWLAMASKVWEHGLRPTNECAQQGSTWPFVGYSPNFSFPRGGLRTWLM